MKDLDLSLPQCLQTPPGCPPGAEPLAHLGDRTGVLLLHGFTGSPWEVRPIADALARLGHTVALPVLAGHATSLRALNETTWQDWLQSAQDALDWLDARTDRIHIIGLSMGALLALLLANRRPPERAGQLVLLAPALCLTDWQTLAMELSGRLGWPELLGKEDPHLPQNPPGYQGIPVRATLSFLQLQRVVRQTIQPQTALVLHGEADQTISCDLAGKLAQPLLVMPGSELRRIPQVGHLLPRTVAGPRVVQDVLEWLDRET